MIIMIPKKIHYCWFGKNEKPALAQKCIESWKKNCPDYEIIEWNEDNFNVYMNAYTRMCYENKKYAFLSDYVRLVVVAEQGGIYFDTDVELVKRIDELLEYDAFYGFEDNEHINTGLGFGSVKEHVVVVQLLEAYTHLLDGNKGVVGCPVLNTNVFQKLGLILNGKRQDIMGAQIFPIDYFNPFDDPTGQLNKTQNTYSIHWYSKSWMDKKTILRSKITRPLHRIFGKDCFKRGNK